MDYDPKELLDASLVTKVLAPDCLSGKRALVTGARFCSIGSATAVALHACGAELAIHAESEAVLAPTAAYFDENGIAHKSFVADFSDPGEATSLGHQVQEAMGGIDIVVHVAGLTQQTELEAVTSGDLHRLYSINSVSAVMLTQALLPGMVKRGGGHVILFSSIAARRVLPGHFFGYAMTKAAVEPFAAYLAVAHGHDGIVSHVVVPGVTDNERHRSDPDLHQALVQDASRQPTGRLVQPIEIGANVAMLCTDLAQQANGSSVLLDGGRLQPF